MFISYKEQNFCNGITIDEMLNTINKQLHLCNGYNHENLKIWPPRMPEPVTDPTSGMDTQVRYEYKKNCKLTLFTSYT